MLAKPVATPLPGFFDRIQIRTPSRPVSEFMDGELCPQQVVFIVVTSIILYQDLLNTLIFPLLKLREDFGLQHLSEVPVPVNAPIAAIPTSQKSITSQPYHE